MDSVVRPGQVRVGVPPQRDTTIHEPLEAQTQEGIEEGEIREDPRTYDNRQIRRCPSNAVYEDMYLVCDPTWVRDELHLDDRGPFFHDLRCGWTIGNSNMEEEVRYHCITAPRPHIHELMHLSSHDRNGWSIHR